MRHLAATFFALCLALPVLAEDEESCTGTPLPADGGAPAQAFSGFLTALHASDVEGMLRYVPNEKVDEARAEMSSPEAAMALGMMQAFMPKEFEVLHATSDGDSACLQTRMESPFGESTSVTKFVREDGNWKIADM